MGGCGPLRRIPQADKEKLRQIRSAGKVWLGVVTLAYRESASRLQEKVQQPGLVQDKDRKVHKEVGDQGADNHTVGL